MPIVLQRPGLDRRMRGWYDGLTVQSLSEQKQRVIEMLSEAYARDYISESELETRLEKAENSQASDALASVVDDLPAEIRALPAAHPAAVSTPLSGDAQRVSVSMGGIRRRGAWLNSSRLQIRCSMGTVKLDISRQVLAAADSIEIDVDVNQGRCILFVPPGTIVEDRVELEMGRFHIARRVHAGRQAQEAPGRIVLSGSVRLGGVKVRRLRR